MVRWTLPEYLSTCHLAIGEVIEGKKLAEINRAEKINLGKLVLQLDQTGVFEPISITTKNGKKDRL